MAHPKYYDWLIWYDLPRDKYKEAKGIRIDPRKEKTPGWGEESRGLLEWTSPTQKKHIYTCIPCPKWIKDETIREDSIGNCSLMQSVKPHVLWIPGGWIVGKPSAGALQHLATRLERRLCFLSFQLFKESQESRALGGVHKFYQCPVLKIIKLNFMGLVD